MPLPSDVQSFHFVDDVFLVGLFVIYCCVTDYHKFGSLKHHTFTLAVFKGQKVRHGLTGSSAQHLTSLPSQCGGGDRLRNKNDRLAGSVCMVPSQHHLERVEGNGGGGAEGQGCSGGGTRASRDREVRWSCCFHRNKTL